MKFYLDKDQDILIEFDSSIDIPKSKQYFISLQSQQDRRYFDDLQIRFEKDEIPKNSKVTLDIISFTDIKSSIPLIRDKDYPIYKLGNSDITALYRYGICYEEKRRESLPIQLLFGRVDLELLVDDKLYYSENLTKPCHTSIHLFPSIVKEYELIKLIQDLRDKLYIVSSLENSLKSFIDTTSNENDILSTHYLIVEKIFKKLKRILINFRLNRTINRNIAFLNHKLICKKKGKLISPKMITVSKTKKIISVVDRIPSSNIKLAENYLVKHFFNKYLEQIEIIKTQAKKNIDQIQGNLSKLKTENEYIHRSYKNNIDTIDELNKIIISCIQIKQYVKRTKTYQELKKESIPYNQSAEYFNINALVFNSRYKVIYSFLQTMRILPSLNYNSIHDLEISVSQLNKLYEEWTFYLLREVMNGSEFKLIKIKDLIQESFTKKVQQSGTQTSIMEFETNSHEYIIKVFREKVYPFIDMSKEKRSYGLIPKMYKDKYLKVVWGDIKESLIDRGKKSEKDTEAEYRGKKCPDISIEIFKREDNIIPCKIITLDCRFSKSPDAMKFAYADTIVLFDGKEVEDIVKVAGCIYWGTAEKREKFRNEVAERRSCYNINLNPSCAKNLMNFFVFLSTRGYLDEFNPNIVKD